MARHTALDRAIGVRIPVPQLQQIFNMAHSSRGLGRRPLTPVTGVRIPYALLLTRP